MKNIFITLVLFVSAMTVRAQIKPSTPVSYNWPVATHTGVVGQYLILDDPVIGIPVSYTIDVYVTGTVPSTCTFEVQSSPDGTTWNTGTNSLSGDVSCASATTLTYSFYSKPDSNIQIKIGTLTGADGSTQIHFFYRRAGAPTR